MITGWKKLTKAQRKHLAESNIRTNHDWQVTRDWQKAHPNTCRECDQIAAVLETSEG